MNLCEVIFLALSGTANIIYVEFAGTVNDDGQSPLVAFHAVAWMFLRMSSDVIWSKSSLDSLASLYP